MDMRFNLETAEIFVPDGLATEEALARTTHMAVGAHQDDLEIMAFDGILKCFQRDDKWFCGVVVTNGSGSPRDDLYKDYTDEAMRVVRRKEQKKAAVVGEYAAQVLLDYPSAAVKDGSNKAPVEDIGLLLKAAKPEVVYTHNLADKHDTHVAVALRVIEAIRTLPATERPQRLYGCEIWRDLDSMVDADKVAFGCSLHENLQTAFEAEPYSYCQFIMGRDHTAFGWARHPWLTGSGGWFYTAATRWMLGVMLSFVLVREW